jgi:hypothetical protein
MMPNAPREISRAGSAPKDEAASKALQAERVANLLILASSSLFSADK